MTMSPKAQTAFDRIKKAAGIADEQPASVEYEREPCTRCGGSGEYSFNQVDGTRCFKCGGLGKQLTKRGAAAAKFADELLVRPIEEVPEGQTFVCDGWGVRHKFCTAVEHKGTIARKGDGTPLRSFDVFTRSGKEVASLGEGIKVRLHPTREQIEQIKAYQDSLTKAGKPRKR